MMKKVLAGHGLKAILFAFAAVLFFLSANSVFGCSINLKTLGDKKDVYAVNDIIQLKVSLEYTHKVCAIALADTKFSVSGLEIAEASEWKEIQPKRKFEKDLKLKVVGNKDGKLVLSVVRTCELGGGTSSVTYKSEPVK